MVRNQLHHCIKQLFKFQNKLALTSKDKEVSRTDTPPFKIKVSVPWLDVQTSGILIELPSRRRRCLPGARTGSRTRRSWGLLRSVGSARRSSCRGGCDTRRTNLRSRCESLEVKASQPASSRIVVRTGQKSTTIVLRSKMWLWKDCPRTRKRVSSTKSRCCQVWLKPVNDVASRHARVSGLPSRNKFQDDVKCVSSSTTRI